MLSGYGFEYTPISKLSRESRRTMGTTFRRRWPRKFGSRKRASARARPKIEGRQINGNPMFEFCIAFNAGAITLRLNVRTLHIAPYGG